MTAQIETQEDFDNALQELLSNEATRQPTIDGLRSHFPDNDVVKVVGMYLGNEQGFGDWVRGYCRART